MQQIVNYINKKIAISLESLNYINTNKYDEELLKEMLNVSNEDLTLFNSNKKTLDDFILENLKSYNFDLVSKKLKEKFKDIECIEYGKKKWKNVKNNYKSGFYIQCEDPNILINNKEFINLLDFYNYYFTQIAIYKGNKVLSIEPKYSEDRTDYVMNDCHGIFYHITSTQLANKILKSGLRAKNADYRIVPERIYGFAVTDSLNKYLNVNNDIQLFIKHSFRKLTADNICVLKINVNQLKNITFYDDSSCDTESAVFTYNNIPASCITEYHLNVPIINENKGDAIDAQWLNDEKPVQTKDGRQVIVTSVDMKEVPNIIHGQVKMKDKLFEYEWLEDGVCQKAVDQFGNPKKTDDADTLVKAI